MTRHRLSSTGRFAAVVVAAMIGLLGAAPAAFAHTSLVSSDPAADSTLTQAPTSVELVFAEQIRSPDPKVAITIAGYDPVEIPATITGSTVSADLDGATIPGLMTATYPVSWTLGYRLIAADGDPFSGLLNFTVSTAPAGAVADPGTAAGTPTATVTAGSTEVTGTSGGVWIVVALIAVATAVVGGILVTRRSRITRPNP